MLIIHTKSANTVPGQAHSPFPNGNAQVIHCKKRANLIPILDEEIIPARMSPWVIYNMHSTVNLIFPLMETGSYARQYDQTHTWMHYHR